MTQSRQDCIDAAGRALAAGRARRDALSPRAAAEEADVPGGQSVDQLEDRIRVQRGLPPIHGGPKDTSPPPG